MSKITLRKAAALQTEIQEAVSQTYLTSIELSPFDENPVDAINTALVTLKESLSKRDLLLTAQYALRKAIGQANHTSGIDDLLADGALLEKRIQMFDNVAQSQVRIKDSIIVGKLAKLSTSSSDGIYRGYGNDTVTAPIITEGLQTEFKALVKSLKKDRQALKDKVLELNVSTLLELPDEVVNVQQLGII